MGKQVCFALLIYNDVDLQQGPSNPSVLREATPTVTANKLSTAEEGVLNKRKIVEELMGDRELMVDTGEDSSGSDSDPSDDNLLPDELDVVLSIPYLKKVQKAKGKVREEIEAKSLPPQITESKRQTSKRVLSVPRKIKCNVCGELMSVGHYCHIKPKPLNKLFANSKSATLVYLNSNGRKVRDQATQTVKLEESKTVSPKDSLRVNKVKVSKDMYSKNKSIALDDSSSIGRFFKKRQLPMIKKLK